MDNIYKYLYIFIISLIIILLIIVFIKLKKLMKKIVILNENSNKINESINRINDKTQEINKSKESIKFFISIYVVFTIIKQTIVNLKKNNNKIAKAFALACLSNASNIKKMR